MSGQRLMKSGLSNFVLAEVAQLQERGAIYVQVLSSINRYALRLLRDLDFCRVDSFI